MAEKKFREKLLALGLWPTAKSQQPPYSRYASFSLFRAVSASALAEFVVTTAWYFLTAKSRC